ncbi:uncharacterized protein PG986_001800 [Apiospora aurea]|uniref:Uncharacterized protein n=1 Tax=Apiospora aurea TaxID=335848 RepID=A0ABR1QXZ6_9PEZI
MPPSSKQAGDKIEESYNNRSKETSFLSKALHEGKEGGQVAAKDAQPTSNFIISITTIMPLTLLTCLVIAALVETLIFSAYCSTLDDGDGCCYPSSASEAGGSSSSYSAYGRYSRTRRRSSTKVGAHGSDDGSGRRTGTVSAPAEMTRIHHHQGGDGGVGNSMFSSSSATLIQSTSEVSLARRSSNSHTSGDLHYGQGYSLRQRIMRRDSRG